MRITVDLDDPDPAEVCRAWATISPYGVGPYGRVSASGHGVHLKVHGFKGSWAHCLTVRLKARDDLRRLWFDMFTVGKPRQITFTKKRGRYAGPWTDNLREITEKLR